MDLNQLTRHVVYGGVDYTYLRPGITLCLIYAEPAQTLAPAVADILEAYIDFIPADSLQTYLAANGTWKKATKRTFNSTLKELRGIGPGEYAEFHFGQEPLSHVGQFGAHLSASPLDDDFYPLDTNILYLEFPADLSTFTSSDALIEFIHKIAQCKKFDSGFCGYAFNHLHLSFRNEVFKEIGKLALRFTGLDICNYRIRKAARGRVCNVSWLNLFGPEITQKLGGPAKIREALPADMTVEEWGDSVMVKASEEPIIGDVNRGAEDAEPLRHLAQLTRELRLDVPNLGPDDDDFAQRWLARFD